MKYEEDILIQAEERRKEKAATMQFVPTVPTAVGDVPAIEARFNKIAEIVKNRTATDSKEDHTLKIREIFQRANVPDRHAKLENPEGGAWLARFHTLRTVLGTGFIAALIGTRGTGKTQMASELIRANSHGLKSSRFVLAMDIFLAIRASYRKDSATDESRVVEEFCKPRLLVIDEIQERAETPFEDRILTHLINRRYNDEKDTLLIGNITEAQFKEAMGSSIVTRLNETGGMIVCNWASFR